MRRSSTMKAMSPRPRRNPKRTTYGGKVAARIRSLRDSHGYSAKELADKCGVLPPTIYSWEKANSSPHLDDLPRLAAAFGMTVTELLGGV